MLDPPTETAMEDTSNHTTAAMRRAERLIVKLENYDKKGELTASLLSRFQQELDRIADIYQYDARAGKERSYLYELQALILLARGEEDNAETALETAAVVSGDPPGFISATAKGWYKDRDAARRQTEDITPTEGAEGRKFNGKLEGWLALYSLTFVVAPILLVVDLVETNGSLNGLQGTQYYDQLSNIMAFARTYDVLQLISLIIFGCLFFAKKKIARTWAIVHTIGVIIGAVVVYALVTDFYTQNNLQVGAGEQSTVTLGTFIWLFYWIFSKRVKETFVN